jgi:hypothetical protein
MLGLLLRFANTAMFHNEMDKIDLIATDGTLVSGADLAQGSNLDNDVSVWGNLGILFGIFIFCRLAALAGLKLAWRMKWL